MTRGRASVRAILDTLGSHRPRAERAAVARLVRVRGRVWPALERAARAHRNAHARGVALAALAQRNPRRARPVLLRALGDRTMVVRLRALIGLNRSPWSPAVARAVAELLRDPSGGIRVNAVDALARRRVRSAAAALERALRDEKGYVRDHAARALSALGDRRGLPRSAPSRLGR